MGFLPLRSIVKNYIRSRAKGPVVDITSSNFSYISTCSNGQVAMFDEMTVRIDSNYAAREKAIMTLNTLLEREAAHPNLKDHLMLYWSATASFYLAEA